jgi:hypothetical protein
VFHVELRQFPHVARAFNLSREELDGRILRPLAAGRPVELDERRWTPGKLKVTVYEGPQLGVEEMGMGRGWGNATRTGEDVTARMLAEARREVESPAELETVKRAIAERCGDGPLRYEQLLALTADVATDADANETVELAARAAWELLRDGRLRLAAPDPEQP